MERTNQVKLALRVDSGLLLGSIFRLENSRNFVGRSPEAQIPVEDSKVSRFHAALDIQQGRLCLVDLGSTNGTFLNGHRVETSEFVSIGDRIRVGSTVLVAERWEKARADMPAHWSASTLVILPKPHSMNPEFGDSPAQSVSSESRYPKKQSALILGGLAIILVLTALITSFV